MLFWCLPELWADESMVDINLSAHGEVEISTATLGYTGRVHRVEVSTNLAGGRWIPNSHG